MNLKSAIAILYLHSDEGKSKEELKRNGEMGHIFTGAISLKTLLIGIITFKMCIYFVPEIPEIKEVNKDLTLRMLIKVFS